MELNKNWHMLLLELYNFFTKYFKNINVKEK